MGASKFWSGVGNVLTLGAPALVKATAGKLTGDQKGALDAQLNAGAAAENNAQSALDYTRNQNESIIKMGDQQLDALKKGVESGEFGMDESIFEDYYTHIAPQYQPGGKYQNEPRENLVTPEKYQYAQSNPAAFQYDQQAPAPFTYNQGQAGTQQTAQSNPTYDSAYAKTLNSEQLNEYNRSIFMPSAQQQQQQQAAAQSNFSEQQPQQLQYQDFQSNQQQPNFNPVQNFGQQPQLYQSTTSPQANYVEPQEQYQGGTFNLQDDPVYQKRLADSNKAIEASAAAKGMQLSGSNLKALQQNASDMAATEGDAAFNRFQQQDQTNYGRFQDQRADLKDTTRYQTEDEYKRYLDTQNIKGTEADKAVAQWNTDRSFNQGANVQNFQTAQDAYSTNRGQDADIYNMNAGNQLAYGAQNLGQYNTNRDFAQGTQAQNFDQYATMRGMAGAENQQNYNQFDTNRQYDADQNQQNINNTIDAYNINNTNYTNDRDFGYGVDQDYNANQFDALKWNEDNSRLENVQNYEQLTDAYNRQNEQKTNKYGMIGDLANAGMTARQQNVDATTGYYGTLSDIGTQKANAQAAYNNRGILQRIGL